MTGTLNNTRADTEGRCQQGGYKDMEEMSKQGLNSDWTKMIYWFVWLR